MPARGIYNLVRALSHPYVGAHTTYKSKEFKIWAVSEIHGQHPNNIEPGKIISVDKINNTFTVKCGTDTIIVTKHEFTSLPEDVKNFFNKKRSG